MSREQYLKLLSEHIKRIVKSINDNDGLSDDVFFCIDRGCDSEWIGSGNYLKDFAPEREEYTHLYIGDKYHVIVDRNKKCLLLYPIMYFNTSEYGIPVEYSQWEVHDEGSEEMIITENSVSMTYEDSEFSFSSDEEKFQQSCTEEGFFHEIIDELFLFIERDFSDVLWEKS